MKLFSKLFSKLSSFLCRKKPEWFLSTKQIEVLCPKLEVEDIEKVVICIHSLRDQGITKVRGVAVSDMTGVDQFTVHKVLHCAILLGRVYKTRLVYCGENLLCPELQPEQTEIFCPYCQKQHPIADCHVYLQYHLPKKVLK